MLRAVLVDDEKPALKVLTRVLEELGHVQVVGAYTDPSEMLKEVEALKPDLAFLDIEMPEMNGLELASRLLDLEEDVEVIFVTAYSQYALEAFRVNALDYLLKPVEPDLLHRTVDRVWKRRRGTTPAKAPMAASRIVCFGSFEIYRPNLLEPIRFPKAKAEELFAYLLVHRNTNISKWTLCDSLWPEVHSSEKNDHNLHTTVYRMKKTLRDCGIGVKISSQRGFYRMECEESSDYVAFEQAAANVAPLNPGTIGEWTKAIQLYKGPLFGNKDYPWCEAERERMSRYFASLSKRLAHWHLEAGHCHEAIETILPLLRYAPFDEEAHELALTAYRGLQDRSAFQSHYAKMETSFREELGVDPPQALQQLYGSSVKS
ncbi:hypothetical protein J31TS4_35160 [Paenibacillus sp. J31TS4]|uniref:response regulator n=1 Tax=Paenibacillus sp. J31TS4 TaxID=2807195 RepID=UPI001AFE7448|nr:response regulator [Paenibacillus sp. J31TS4]GIP40236.1 hypothetical protein J31TS4_35160 [Paenibacillus sp. J31TS4]